MDPTSHIPRLGRACKKDLLVGLAHALVQRLRLAGVDAGAPGLDGLGAGDGQDDAPSAVLARTSAWASRLLERVRAARRLCSGSAAMRSATSDAATRGARRTARARRERPPAGLGPALRARRLAPRRLLAGPPEDGGVGLVRERREDGRREARVVGPLRRLTSPIAARW